MPEVPATEWVYYGSSGHFICGRWCRFHLATKIGKWFISTVGEFVHPKDSGGSEATEARYLTDNPLGADIGYGRKFETLVFQYEGECDCGCGLPHTIGFELDSSCYNDRKSANEGHLAMCKKWASITEIPEDVDKTGLSDYKEKLP